MHWVELLFVAGERIIKVNVCTLSSHQPNYKRRGPGKTKMHTTITITLQCTKLIMINQSPAFSIVTSSVYQDTHHLIVRISVFKRDICIWEIIWGVSDSYPNHLRGMGPYYGYGASFLSGLWSAMNLALMAFSPGHLVFWSHPVPCSARLSGCSLNCLWMKTNFLISVLLVVNVIMKVVFFLLHFPPLVTTTLEVAVPRGVPKMPKLGEFCEV